MKECVRCGGCTVSIDVNNAPGSFYYSQRIYPFAHYKQTTTDIDLVGNGIA